MNAEEYAAAVGRGAIFEWPGRALLLVEGRQPARMLTGIVSGRMPPDPAPVEDRVVKGEAPWSLVLTPKGKVVTDLRLFRLEEGEEGAHLMDVPRSGLDGLLEHLKRYLPPRLARIVEPPEPMGMLTVTGSDAARLLSREALGLRVDAPVLEDMAECEERVLADGSPLGIRVVRAGEVGPVAFDVLAAESTLRAIGERLRESGLVEAGAGVHEILRMERGRPAYGVEMDRDTLPPEAGVVERMIDYHKGCYTGQEVIVRIRDRGRVNRHLRGILLGDLPLPDPGTPLFVEGRDREAGEIRSAVRSPRFGQGIALGYLRREAEPPTVARLGEVDGPEVQVRALMDSGPEGGWVLAEGDHGG